ncbi:MAG: S41 family peptidase [Pirellulaceae bacterium]
MPIRNLLFIGLATLISLACYSIAAKNRYASIFSEAMDIVQSEALVHKTERELFDAAMNGMLGILDENSGFVSHDQFETFNDDLNQQFVGVGMTVDRDEERNALRVISPIPGTPAYKAGLRVDDRILEIDGATTRDLSQQEAIKRIRGPRGDSVVFLVEREDVDEPFEIEVVRDTIPVPSVYGDLRRPDGTWSFVLQDDPRIGYVRLMQFGKRSTDEVRDAIHSLDGKIDGFILDLRYNPGGLLEAAVKISDMFIGREVPVVKTLRRDGTVVRTRFATSKTELDPNIPVVVIVNEYSASASEIVSACLQDHGRAKVVGAQTWGKGTVQDLITLEPNRSVMRLTTASYWRPSGQNIDRTVTELDKPDQYGVKPDPGFEVPLTETEMGAIGRARNERDQDVVEEGTTPNSDQAPWIETDLPLKRAVDHLHSLINSRAAA